MIGNKTQFRIRTGLIGRGSSAAFLTFCLLSLPACAEPGTPAAAGDLTQSFSPRHDSPPDSPDVTADLGTVLEPEASGCGQRTMTVDLVDWLEALVDSLPGRHSSGFTSPSTTQIEDFETLVTALLAGECETARQLAALTGYEVVTLVDEADEDEEVVALLPGPDGNTGRGFYFVRPESQVDLDLNLEAPHPRFDLSSGTVAAIVFREARARSLAVAGTHRCANPTPSPCDGETTVCNDKVSGPYRISDMAHNDAAYFQAFHRAMSMTPTITLQIHGFETRPDLPEFIVSDGTRADTSNESYTPNRLAESLQSVLIEQDSDRQGISCNRIGDPNMLCGTANVQGRYTNAPDIDDACSMDAPFGTGRFIHLELSYDLRHPGGWLEPDDVVEAVLDAFAD